MWRSVGNGGPHKHVIRSDTIDVVNVRTVCQALAQAKGRVQDAGIKIVPRLMSSRRRGERSPTTAVRTTLARELPFLHIKEQVVDSVESWPHIRRVRTHTKDLSRELLLPERIEVEPHWYNPPDQGT